MRIVYSPINAAYFLMWNETVISIGSKSELEFFCKLRGIEIV